MLHTSISNGCRVMVLVKGMECLDYHKMHEGLFMHFSFPFYMCTCTHRLTEVRTMTHCSYFTMEALESSLNRDEG